MSQNKAGGLATFFALIGLVGYALADLFTAIYVTSLFQQPATAEEGIGQIFVVLVTFLYAMGLTILGTFFMLLGKIWKQSMLVVILAMLTYGIIFGGFSIVAIFLLSDGGDIATIGVIWGIMLLILIMIFKGFQNATNRP